MKRHLSLGLLPIPLRLLLVLALLPATTGRAGALCPQAGDLAPGTLDGTTWTVTGDGETTIADAIVALRVAAGDWTLAPLGGCPGDPVDVAPGVARGTEWIALGNALLDECDALVFAELILGRRTPLVADLPYPEWPEAEVAALVSLDDLAMDDATFRELLALLLEGVDAEADGPGMLRAYLEGEIGGECMPLPPLGAIEGEAAIAGETTPQGFIDRIQATQAWKMLEAFVSTVIFAAVPEPGASLLQVAQPETFVALSTIVVRADADRALVGLQITPEQYATVVGALATNPYHAKRLLLEALGQPIPDWLAVAPEACVRQCPPPAESCAVPGDEDGDGQADCDDPDCAAWPDCIPEELCTGGVDEDGDGLTDCDDTEDCSGTAACGEHDCGNGIDDDQDGQTDCGDLDCIEAAGCREDSCGDGIDDDGDGLTDCDDPNCVGSLDCGGPPPVYCGCYFDTSPPDVNDWWWRCHQQESENFSAPYDALVSPGECNCDPELFVICE